MLKRFVNFKLSLLPYLYNQCIHAHRFGHPMMRPLFAEFPEDAATWHLDTQYMLGENLLVAPVFNNEGDVEYYLPKGDWYGVLDGKFRHGPGYVSEKHDYFSLPVLLRPGAALVIGNCQDVALYDWTDCVTLLVNQVEGVDIVVDIPDHEKPGEIKTQLTVKCTLTGITVDVVKGSLGGKWQLAVPGKQFKQFEDKAFFENTTSAYLEYA